MNTFTEKTSKFIDLIAPFTFKPLERVGDYIVDRVNPAYRVNQVIPYAKKADRKQESSKDIPLNNYFYGVRSGTQDIKPATDNNERLSAQFPQNVNASYGNNRNHLNDIGEILSDDTKARQQLEMKLSEVGMKLEDVESDEIEIAIQRFNRIDLCKTLLSQEQPHNVVQRLQNTIKTHEGLIEEQVRQWIENHYQAFAKDIFDAHEEWTKVGIVNNEDGWNLNEKSAYNKLKLQEVIEQAKNHKKQEEIAMGKHKLQMALAKYDIQIGDVGSFVNAFSDEELQKAGKKAEQNNDETLDKLVDDLAKAYYSKEEAEKISKYYKKYTESNWDSNKREQYKEKYTHAIKSAQYTKDIKNRQPTEKEKQALEGLKLLRSEVGDNRGLLHLMKMCIDNPTREWYSKYAKYLNNPQNEIYKELAGMLQQALNDKFKESGANKIINNWNRVISDKCRLYDYISLTKTIKDEKKNSITIAAQKYPTTTQAMQQNTQQKYPTTTQVTQLNHKQRLQNIFYQGPGVSQIENSGEAPTQVVYFNQRPGNGVSQDGKGLTYGKDGKVSMGI